MHPRDEQGVDDMATLTELHGGSILYNLFQRYKRNQIYVSAVRGAPCSPAALSPSGCSFSKGFSCLLEPLVPGDLAAWRVGWRKLFLLFLPRDTWLSVEASSPLGWGRQLILGEVTGIV